MKPSADKAEGAAVLALQARGSEVVTSAPARHRSTTEQRAKIRHALIVRSAQIIPVILILVAWQHLGSQNPFWNTVVSTPTQIFSLLASWAGDPHRWRDITITLQEAGLGYLLGVLIAVLLALVLNASNWLKDFAGPFISALNAIPKIVLAPLFIVWFGIDLASKVYFVASAIFFIVFYNLFVGVRSIDPLYLANARALGASRVWLMREVYAPAILGWLMTSLRLSAAWSLLSAVISEYLGSNRGLGFLIAEGERSLAVTDVLAGILIVASVALAMDRLLVRIERHYARWRLF